MNRILLGGVAIIAILAAASSSAGAADLLPAPPVLAVSDIVRANNQVSLDFAATDFNYVETLPPTYPVFDSEKSWVAPGLSVSASVMGNYLGLQNLYASGRVTWVDGHTKYWSAPLTNTDGAVVWNEDFRVGKGFDLSNNVMLTPYLGAGARNWSRNLPGAGGYHESYSNGYLGAGLLVQVAPISRLVLSAYGLAGGTSDATMVTSRNGGYPINPYQYSLKGSNIYIAGASADYAITERIHANIGVDYVAFKYGQSPPSPIDGSLEPTSHTSNVTLLAGIGYAF